MRFAEETQGRKGLEPRLATRYSSSRFWEKRVLDSGHPHPSRNASAFI